MSSGRETLPDVLQSGLRIVFCGTAAGRESARRGAYYAGRGNRFWWALHAVGLSRTQLQPDEFTHLPDVGLGLTDLAKFSSGMDRELTRNAFDRDGLREKLTRYAPRIVAFTSKRAGEAFLGFSPDYGMQAVQVGSTRLFVLPSPSGAARRYWSIAPWHELARAAATAFD